jgi:tRNA C32,U32 (ribose-2'-O)-methylase TrmJ
MRALAGDAIFKIPGAVSPLGPVVESLNLAAAVQICAYELRRC